MAFHIHHDDSTEELRVRRPLFAAFLIGTLMLGGIAGGIVGAFSASMIAYGRPVSWQELRDAFSGSRTAGPMTNIPATKLPVTVEENSATIQAVEKASPAVVNVILTQDLSKVKDQFGTDPFNDFFFSFPFAQPAPQEGVRQISAGSGFVVSSDGLIITNKHVVQDQADIESVDLTVIFNDGTEHPAKVLGVDPLNDLAVLRIDGKNLPTLEFGDSDALKLGQSVVAIGNALGEYRNTVTDGVVSGIHRTIQAGDGRGSTETIEDAIQTDAAINRGNSGGPLINLSGQVVGVNTAIDEQGRLIGFAIPSNVARQVLESVQKSGTIVRPYLGVRYALINEEIQRENNLSVDYGALIVRGAQQSQLAIIPGSPADKAGLVENDIILEVNGQKVDAEHPLTSFMRKAKVGDTITLKILHKGEERSVDVKLEEFKENDSSTNTSQ